MDLDEIITNSICKFTKLANQKILEIAIYKNFLTETAKVYALLGLINIHFEFQIIKTFKRLHRGV